MEDGTEALITNSIKDLLENGLGIPVCSIYGDGGPRLTPGWSAGANFLAESEANGIDSVVEWIDE